MSAGPMLATSTRLALGDLRANCCAPCWPSWCWPRWRRAGSCWRRWPARCTIWASPARRGTRRAAPDPDVYDPADISLGAHELATARTAAGDDAELVSTPLVLRLVEVDGRVLQLRAADTADCGLPCTA